MYLFLGCRYCTNIWHVWLCSARLSLTLGFAIAVTIMAIEHNATSLLWDDSQTTLNCKIILGHSILEPIPHSNRQKFTENTLFRKSLMSYFQLHWCPWNIILCNEDDTNKCSSGLRLRAPPRFHNILWWGANMWLRLTRILWSVPICQRWRCSSTFIFCFKQFSTKFQSGANLMQL